MKEYFRFFRIPFGIIGVLLMVTIGACVYRGLAAKTADAGTSVSTNTERDTTERVFDYAEVLSDEEENLLREQIKESELMTQSDIVIVTLNQSLVEYAASYEDKIGPVPIDKCVMVFADNFYEEHGFGYNKPNGDGVLLLDNWYRESDGYVYSWMCTTGKVEDAYSSAMIDEVLDESLYYVEDSPYKAYSVFIDEFVSDMTAGSFGESKRAAAGMATKVGFMGGILAAVIFLVYNWSGRKGRKTVNNHTYVSGGQPVLKNKVDQFINKTVTKTKIESSSSSGGGGGGGHHRSSSGGSHGGGGHRR